MIIQTGYIKITTASEGGLENGIPQRATTTTSDFISANINENRRSHGQIGDETEGTKASYTILIDPADAPEVSDRDKVEVFDMRQASLGTFDIQSARLLEYVEAIKILV